MGPCSLICALKVATSGNAAANRNFSLMKILELIIVGAHLGNENMFQMVQLLNELACALPIRLVMGRSRHKSDTCAFQLYCE